MLVASIAAALALALSSGSCPDVTSPAIAWRGSTAIGTHEHGHLVNGVQLPGEGTDYTTWDPGRETTSSDGWRRVGTDRLISTTLCVIDQFRAAHRAAARVLIGDISLPKGGPFGNEFGGLGHVSHQIGLDVDIYYPRKDGRETAPARVRDIDHELAQDLIDRFTAAGAITIYIGPRTKLRGPARVVQIAKNHDNHFHVRYAKPPRISATTSEPVGPAPCECPSPPAPSQSGSETETPSTTLLPSVNTDGS